jgi:hypothetical protein
MNFLPNWLPVDAGLLAPGRYGAGQPRRVDYPKAAMATIRMLAKAVGKNGSFSGQPVLVRRETAATQIKNIIHQGSDDP